MEDIQELTTALSGVVTKITESGTGIESFVLEQAPVVVSQLITMETITAITYIILCAILPILFGYGVVKKWELGEGWLGFVFITFVSTFAMFMNIAALIKVTVAPSVFILEYAKGLVS